MRHMEIKTRGLNFDEHKAVLKATEILSKAFDKDVFKVVVRSNYNNRESVQGIDIQFDIKGD